MSRANPIALRIASKTQSSPFIGVSQYYFYNHVKQNININKLTVLLSKQSVLPTNKLAKHNAINSDSFSVLAPDLLPINTACIAKQLFSTKYTLNKRRFSSTALHYIRWLQEDFDINYKRFNTNCVKNENFYKSINLPIAYPNVNGQSTIKKDYNEFCLITKSNQINTLYKYFVLNRAAPSASASDKCLSKSSQTLGLAYLFGSALHSRVARSWISMQAKKKSITKFNSNFLYIQNFKKTQNRSNSIRPTYDKGARPILQNFHQQFCFKPYYANMVCNMFLLMCLNLLYPHQAVNKTPISGFSLTSQLSIRQQRTLLTTAKSGRFPSSLVADDLNSVINNNLDSQPCYAMSAYSGLKKSKSSSSNKVQKHISSFRGTAKLLTSLQLIIYRSFCEPAGLNYITALENRLSKSGFNTKFSSAVFTRTSKNGFISNYTNIQTGLIRLKAQMLFEFLYIRSNSDKSLVEQSNNSSQFILESRNKKLWLRKCSSIRL